MIESTPRWHNYLPPEGVGTPTYANRPERNGYIGRTNKRTCHWKRRNEPRYYAPRRIHSTRRVYAKGARRRKDERSPRS